MASEQLLAAFIRDTNYDGLSQDTIATVKRELIAFYGALIAGSATPAEAAADYVSDIGGKAEATVFIKGGKVPAHQAAFANAAVGRALDIDDHIGPGAHIGAGAIPAAFAAAELIGGCSGKDFVTAVAIGVETSLRLKLLEEDYAGFDPTGITSIFAAAAAAAKLLGLDERDIWNTLGLAFDRCGASFQHYIDGVLGGPVMQGWLAEAGVECARLTQYKITGTVNFLEGVYGYFHLYGRDKADIAYVTEALGTKWNVPNLNFKKYPSCGLTQGSTELTLKMMQEHGFGGADVERVEIPVPPFTHKLVGHPFKIGDNPRVDAQFNVAYCVSNALLRAPVTLAHFEEKQIRDPEIEKFIKEKVTVISDPSVGRTHYSTDLRVWTKDGKEYHGQIDIPPGTPGNPMTDEDHRSRFYDCVGVSGIPWLKGREESILSFLNTMEEQEDVRGLIPYFIEAERTI
ncbi:MAG: MmgE/PrpD family protein [Clostridiales Family XIII bacterium]|jgi:2-methylcitrate dehydratase PrpD|nr:MmgE/PrpD family protein [Clostridiales Family XIII bacterium]